MTTNFDIFFFLSDRIPANMRATNIIITFFAFLQMQFQSNGEKATTNLPPFQSFITANGGSKSLPLDLTNIGRPWCKMQSFNLTIRRRGCEPKTVTKNLCFGQCRSFYVPFRKKTFESCAYCTPVAFTVKSVLLNCPGRSQHDRMAKSIKVVTACSCRVCGTKYIN